VKCPRCRPQGGDGGPYRVAVVGQRPALVPEQHPSGITLDRCSLCAGAFLEHGELGKIESWDREHGKRRVRQVDFVRRAYEQAIRPETGDPTDEPVALDCPACGEVMFEREWSIGTMVRVDVCLECRGVWLDPGELETLEGLFGRR
jgi:Zn-finger nucleic acid-binding protein